MTREPKKTVAWSIHAREGLDPIEGDTFFNLMTGEKFEFRDGKWNDSSAMPIAKDGVILDPQPVEAPETPVTPVKKTTTKKGTEK